MKAKKRLLSLLLTFSMLLGLMPVGSVSLTAWAEGTEPELSADGYYEIYTADQLYWFAEQVNGGNASINARLMDNIVINENVLTADGELNGDGSGFKAWTPIGTTTYNYKGIFDGNNKTISGIYVNNSSVWHGLFGRNDGTIQNVGVVDSYIKAYTAIGGVCAYNDSNGTIINCYNTGTVSGNGYVGGVCGYNYGTISNSYNTGSVSGETSYVGGMCGFNANGFTISNCYNTGSVSGEYQVGGVCGYNSKGTISNCYNTGLVSGASSYVGGVCGITYNAIFSNCYYLTDDESEIAGIGVAWSDEEKDYIPIEDRAGITEAKTSEQFASGEVCWLLNNQGENGEQLETSVWYQNVDMGEADALPLLYNEHYAVYKTENLTYECEAATKPSGEYTNMTGGHSFGTEWTADADNHWHECACGLKADDEAAHTFEWITDKEAEIGVAGSKHEECTVCGYAKEAVVIPALELPEDSSATDSTDDDSSASDDSSAADSESSQADDSEESTAASDSKAESASDSSSTSGDKSPNTGDNRSVLLFAFVLAGGTALAGTAAYSKKRGKQGR
ncbi:LPXTG cell wall anchor domain-containing protein [Ruminococcus sp. Marseille-P6503]|uniref:GLUG motif-containing protein n=1 Tax=Ruminococcus sp. Marseille-P6503 TaxID=2364796 RepID=UPI000F523865|nr:LPXTG cell wall anchor domain-containing protein [Ruminococcus sp. Marseille-P6503]